MLVVLLVLCRRGVQTPAPLVENVSRVIGRPLGAQSSPSLPGRATGPIDEWNTAGAEPRQLPPGTSSLLWFLLDPGVGEVGSAQLLRLPVLMTILVPHI